MRGRSNCNHIKKNKRKHTYHYSIITMVHTSAGRALDSFHQGWRLQQRPSTHCQDSAWQRLHSFFLQMYTIMWLLRANSSRTSLTSLVPAYYILNHSVTFIWLVATTTHPSFLKHVRVTATAVRLKRPTCASKNSLSTLSALSLGGQGTFNITKKHAKKYSLSNFQTIIWKSLYFLYLYSLRQTIQLILKIKYVSIV